ncbi:MAG TPA: winged helix-turn-helix domain-containing protein [Gillisia sp.]|nr:winged helix-turn-helix domain-containing protein [Gillisia sp.]
MNDEAMNIQKKELVEKLGVNFEKLNKLAPVAARIFATLILTEKKGITFEELVEELNASKSTISTHLEHLQSLNKISYETRPGDRKRYFIIHPNLILNIIEEMIEKWNNEKSIHQDIIDYKEKRKQNTEKEEPECDIEFNKNFLIFLDEATTAIQKLKLNVIEKKYQ